EGGLAEEHGDLAAVLQVGGRGALAALPQTDVVVVEDHGAAARRDLGEAAGQHGGHQTHVGGKRRVDVLVQNLGNGGHDDGPPRQCRPAAAWARSGLLISRLPASRRASSVWASARRMALMSSALSGSDEDSTVRPSGVLGASEW